MADNDRMVVFVHGWSVQNTDTYGQLPRRLEREAQTHNLNLDVHHILLGKYISFRDEVRVEDIARAFRHALGQELGQQIDAGKRFICITHSTGGPVVREWYSRFYRDGARARPCPMSHLIMLAPANFGSALAQVGKSLGARLKSWWEGVQPGTGVLDWLELGSSDSWDLNLKWISGQTGLDADLPVFPFVLTGQSIHREFYDNLNSYTDESGSDGVVRTSAANLNATYVRLEQTSIPSDPGNILPVEIPLEMTDHRRTPPMAFALIPGRSHSGTSMGIMRSVQNDSEPHPTVDAILKCMLVSSRADYDRLLREFVDQSNQVANQERVETVERLPFMPDAFYIHDRHTMMIFRVRDDRGYPISDFDLTLLGQIGDRSGANFLPKGFFVDRQKNTREGNVLTYYFCHDAMVGAPEVLNPKDQTRVLRERFPGADGLGLHIAARPDTGMVRYIPGSLAVSSKILREFIRTDETTLVEIVLRRVVHEGVFRFTRDLDHPDPFADQKPGAAIS
jgi:hypothetical protein